MEVHLDRLTPNRPLGWASTVIAPNVVEPEFVGELPAAAATAWRIDLTQRTVTLAEAAPRHGEPASPLDALRHDRRTIGRDDMPALARLSLPYAPMVGCLSVAPARGQAISTATSGNHGGNMDYRGFAEGAAAFFPVFVPGALFHLGDCHAVQGDGEIVGTGAETSFDVQLTVRVRKGKAIAWPRGENDTYIFALGNARPLDEALQHATTGMIRWLGAEYGLEARAACTLLGQSSNTRWEGVQPRLHGRVQGREADPARPAGPGVNALKDRVLRDGRNLGNGILSVDGFINHQIDPR